MLVPNDGKGGTETFDGWFYQGSDGATGTKFDFTQPVLNSATIVPRFTRNFNVKFNYPRNNGTGTEGTDVTETAQEDSTIQVPTRVPVATNGQKFVYWYDSETASNIAHLANNEAPEAYVFGVDKVTRDLALAGYFANVSTVSFHTDGAPVNPQFVTDGTHATAPAVSRAGFDFIGWATRDGVSANNYSQFSFDFATAINDNLDLYAVWAPKEVNYNIVYWVEKLDENGNPYSTMVDRVTYDVVGKTAANDTALTDSFVTLNTDEINQHFKDLLAKSGKTDAIHFAHLDHADQNVQILGNGQTSINVYYALNDYTFDFNFGNDNYIVNDKNIFWVVTRPLSVQQNGNSNQKEYVFTAKYGQNISSEWPLVSGSASTKFEKTDASDPIYEIYFSGWYPKSSNSSWVTKRVNVTADMLTIASNSDHKISLTPTFISLNSGIKSTTHYYLQSIGNKPTAFYNPTTKKYYDLLNNYEDHFIIKDNVLGAKPIPGTATSSTAARIAAVSIDESNQVFNLYYDRQSYNLNFDYQTSTLKNNQTNYQFGCPVTPADLPTPERDGYVFDGWFIDANTTQPFIQNGQPQFTTMPGRDVTLFAKWTRATYHVHYYADYNAMITGNELTDLEQVYALNDSINLPDKYTQSYVDNDRGRFLNWNYMVGNAAVGLKSELLVTRDYNVFGSYDAVHFNINYQLTDGHQGHATDTSKYGLGTTVRLADKPADWSSSNKNDVFVGWSYNGKNYLPGDFVKIDHNLVDVSAASADQALTFTERYAVKDQIINVTFVPNDPDNASQTSQTFQVVAGQDVHVLTQSALNDFSHPFLGWSTSQDATDVKPSFADLTAGDQDITLYGHWLQVTVAGTRAYNGLPTDATAKYTVSATDVSGLKKTTLNVPEYTAADFTRINGKNAGDYELKLNQIGLTKLAVANPNLDFSNVSLGDIPAGTFTITPKEIVVTPSNSSKVYGVVSDGRLPVTITDKNGQPATIIAGDSNVFNISRVEGENVRDGGYPISVTKGSNANYTVKPGEPAAFTITAAPLNIFTTNEKQQYSGKTLNDLGYTPDVKFGDDTPVTLPGLHLTLDDFTFTKDGQTIDGKNVKSVGDYAWTINNSGLKKIYTALGSPTGTSSNADFSFNESDLTGTYTITKAPLSVTVNDAKLNIGAKPNYTSTVTGWLDKQPINIVYSTDRPIDDADMYVLKGAVTNAENYDVSVTAGELYVYSLADLDVHDIKITQGEKWSPEMNFGSAINDYGEPVDWQGFLDQHGIVTEMELVDTSKLGEYTVLFVFGDPVIKSVTIKVVEKEPEVKKPADTKNQGNASKTVISTPTKSAISDTPATVNQTVATPIANVTNTSSESDTSLNSDSTISLKESQSTTRQLPHTGQTDDQATAELGLVGLLSGALALLGITSKKRKAH